MLFLRLNRYVAKLLEYEGRICDGSYIGRLENYRQWRQDVDHLEGQLEEIRMSVDRRMEEIRMGVHRRMEEIRMSVDRRIQELTMR